MIHWNHPQFYHATASRFRWRHRVAGGGLLPIPSHRHVQETHLLLEALARLAPD